MENRSLGDVGGTPGGLGHFLIGCVVACLGGYFLANQVSVVGSYWTFYGANTFGITLVPMLLGVGILFWNGRSLAGWILTVAGALFILAGVIANLNIYFRPTSLKWSATVAAAVTSWVTTIMVFSSSRQAISLINSQTLASITRSSPENGSSISKKCSLQSSCCAMAILCRWPPEI